MLADLYPQHIALATAHLFERWRRFCGHFASPSLASVRLVIAGWLRSPTCRNAVLWLGLCALSSAHAYEVVDDRGVTLRFAAPPQRIVSLLPSLTESVCALGQCARLVGVDRYSNFPASVKQLPQVGGGLGPNVEAIVALKPDLVLMAASTRLDVHLHALGIQVLVLEPKNHADVQRTLALLAQALADGDAQALWRDIDARLLAAAQSLPPQVANTRVYFEVNRAPFAAGESSFIGETLTRLGAKNIVPASLGPFPQLNPEFVVRANPDVIMVGDMNYAGLDGRPGWVGIRAIQRRHVCVFTPAQTDALVRPGPRLAEGAEVMAACLRKALP